MTVRRLLYRLHLTTALAAGLWLTVVGVSGTLLVFGREIDAALSSDLLRVEPRATRASFDEMLRAVNAESSEPVFRIRLPQAADEAAEYWLTSATGRRAYVDPYSARLLGTRGPRESLLGVVHDLHVELLLGKTGRMIVGAFGGCLLILACGGAWLWWPGWRGLRQAFRRPGSASRQVRLYVWHRLIGACAWPLLVASATTGLALVFDDAATSATALATGLPHPEPPPRVEPASDAAPPRFDDALRIARAALPDAVPTWIWMPSPTNGTLAVRLRAPGEWHVNGRSFVYLDARSLEVLRTIDARRSADVTQATNQFYPLHTGSFGGNGTRGLMLIAGLAPGVLFATGVGSWWLRRRKRRAAEASATLT